MKKALLLLISLFLVGLWFSSGAVPLDATLLRKAEGECTKRRSQLNNKRYVTIIDYRKNLLQHRLWVYDRVKQQVVLNARVSHAWNSGFLYANDFSNSDGSNKNCTGSFITLDSYQGHFGYALRVQGVSEAVNTNALKRAIVFHPDPGYRWSKGCFMTDAKTNVTLINLIKGGSLVYVAR